MKALRWAADLRASGVVAARQLQLVRAQERQIIRVSYVDGELPWGADRRWRAPRRQAVGWGAAARRGRWVSQSMSSSDRPHRRWLRGLR